ncbi:MAG: type II toxin-antitoxin system death-on-curing family toxin [Bacteroidota bacterium]
MTEPRWLTRATVLALHRLQIEEHGGSHGLRDEGLLDSALARPRQKHAYEPESDLATPAAAYGFGLAKNHAFVDGNERIAFVTIYVFLGLRGHDLDAPEPEVVNVIESVAAGSMSETALAEWLRAAMLPLT